MDEIKFKINRDDDPSEIIDKLLEELLDFGILVEGAIILVDYGEDQATITLKKKE